MLTVMPLNFTVCACFPALQDRILRKFHGQRHVIEPGRGYDLYIENLRCLTLPQVKLKYINVNKNFILRKKWGMLSSHSLPLPFGAFPEFKKYFTLVVNYTISKIFVCLFGIF